MNSIFAKISSRENISNSLFAKISSRENNVFYSTRQDRKIYLCFCNIKEAYNKCYKKDPIGISDHILLLPTYPCKVKTEKPVKRLVKQWECDSTEQLQNCLDTTDWNILYSDDVNECVETVSSYIQFCENNIVPSKELCYPNNKPWLSKELKQKLITKRQYIIKIVYN